MFCQGQGYLKVKIKGVLFVVPKFDMLFYLESVM